MVVCGILRCVCAVEFMSWSFQLINIKSGPAKGALAQLTVLGFNKNQIGDVGMSAFARAVAKGSLAQLTVRTLFTA